MFVGVHKSLIVKVLCGRLLLVSNKPATNLHKVAIYRATLWGVSVYTIKRKDMGFIACKIKIPAIHHGQRGYN